MPNQNPLTEMSMYITKASMRDGVMQWAAVNSDTDYDSYDERMSLDLYKDFIKHIKSEQPVPAPYGDLVCSDYWCGGMPYLSISHYPDLEGEAVPGETLEIFVDGNKLKAKGYLFDSPMGHAVWRSLKEDKDKQSDEKIRISIGFLDVAHKHGESGKLFVRESATSICHECLEGVGNKIYVQGYLVHLALTRVPVNKRTEMVLEEKSDMSKKKTRKDDAASIVGDTLAEEVELKNKATAQKSDVLIEMSESEEVAVEKADDPVRTVTKEEPPEPAVEEPAVEEVAETAEVAAEPVEEPVVEEKGETFEDSTMTAVAEQPAKFDESLPLAGATTLGDAKEYVEAVNELSFVMESWGMLSTVVWNIIDRSDVKNKKDMVTKAIDDFRNVLTAKALVVFSEAKEDHPLQGALDELILAVDGSVEKSNEEKAEILNPMLTKLGADITDYLERKSVSEQPVPEDNDEESLEKTLQNILQPIVDSVAELKAEVSVVKSQNSAQDVDAQERIPQPRTAVVDPSLIQKSVVKNTSQTPKLRDIIDKSVGN